MLPAESELTSMRHVLTLADLRPAELEHIFAISEDLKTKFQNGLREPLLPGRVLALLFEKPSLRTRVSFESAMSHLGGRVIFLGQESGFGKRESMEDFSRVLSQYVDCVVARTFSHDTLTELAQFSSCSVINGLSAYTHPCQAIADLFSLRERYGRLKGLTLAYVGDGNNVARSLALGCGMVGMKFVLCAPEKYQFEPEFVKFVEDQTGETPEVTDSAEDGVKDAIAIYTDVWTSMGQEEEKQQRHQDLADYQVNADLMKLAPEDACFMHCLPAHRGEEVTAEVIDGPQSIIVEQAANRMHAQKGLLAWLLGSQSL
ncbi:Ornithine carbamoyltransferase [Planctomycetales bacterium 10988]|nr:Ornithine carbamoyltransferase [Planctomycetales bacterium 10988]